MNKHHSSNSSCQLAEPYYYDFLHDKKDNIPEGVSGHIADCPDCQNELQWLTQLIVDSQESPQQNKAIAHARQIELHCDLINRPVSCSGIKSFLPILAMPEMDIQVTTPVMAHIQACEECAHDLETLKQLNLSPEQLSGLSQIMSQKQSEDIDGVLSVTDTFFRDKKDSGIAIRRIMDRPDSGVITVLRFDNETELNDDLTCHIKVTPDASEPQMAPPTAPPQVKPIKSPATASRSWFLKPVAAAAAILVVAVLLFQSPSLKATDIGEVYEALKNVKNIMMIQYDADIEAPVQTTYISRSLGIKLFGINGDFTLYDINSKTQKMKASSAAEIQQADIDQEMVRMIAETMDAPWGLLPFKKASDLPKGAVWQKVQPAQTGTVSGQTEIFDLFWDSEAAGRGNIRYQWRCYLDAASKRPFKVEWRRENQQSQEYELITITEISYPTENQMKEVVQQVGL